MLRETDANEINRLLCMEESANPLPLMVSDEVGAVRIDKDATNAIRAERGLGLLP